MGLTIIYSWLYTRFFSSASLQTMENTPALYPYNPKFLAKLCVSITGIPYSAKILNEEAS